MEPNSIRCIGPRTLFAVGCLKLRRKLSRSLLTKVVNIISILGERENALNPLDDEDNLSEIVDTCLSDKNILQYIRSLPSASSDQSLDDLFDEILLSEEMELDPQQFQGGENQVGYANPNPSLQDNRESLEPHSLYPTVFEINTTPGKNIESGNEGIISPQGTNVVRDFINIETSNTQVPDPEAYSTYPSVPSTEPGSDQNLGFTSTAAFKIAENYTSETSTISTALPKNEFARRSKKNYRVLHSYTNDIDLGDELDGKSSQSLQNQQLNNQNKKQSNEPTLVTTFV